LEFLESFGKMLDIWTGRVSFWFGFCVSVSFEKYVFWLGFLGTWHSQNQKRVSTKTKNGFATHIEKVNKKCENSKWVFSPKNSK